MRIERISAENLNLIPEVMDVESIGDVVISYTNNNFQYSIDKNILSEDFTFPTSKPNKIIEFNNNRYGFVMTENDQYVGHAVIEHRFNNTLYIEDFDINPQCRGKKYAISLMNFLESHAKESKLSGLSLEVQNNNAVAFLFYIKTGFIIGGFDLMFYEKTRQKGQTAIYLYKMF